MKQTIIPKFCEGKTSKAGKAYWSVEDDERYVYSVFEKDVADKLCQNFGTPCDVEVMDSKDGKFKNIRRFYASGPGAQARQETSPMRGRTDGSCKRCEGAGCDACSARDTQPRRAEVNVGPMIQKHVDRCMGKPDVNEKLASILVSYAKDMWCARPDSELSILLNQVVKAYELALGKL